MCNCLVQQVVDLRLHRPLPTYKTHLILATITPTHHPILISSFYRSNNSALAERSPPPGAANLVCMASTSDTSTPQPRATVTCRRCKQQFVPEDNHAQACRYHSMLWTGGEIAKAIGFCRESDKPEHQLRAVYGRTGLLRFWDCCGKEEEDAPGCCVGRHVTYDDPDQ